MSVFSAMKARPDDVRNLTSAERDRLLISAINLDGKWHSLSFYGDDQWRLVDSTTNRYVFDQTLHFSRLPEGFRDVIKAVIYRYVVRGRDGCVRPCSGTVNSFFRYLKPFLQHLERLKIQRLDEVTPLICKLYVDAAKATLSKRSGLPIKATTLLLRFLAVESLHELSQYTDHRMRIEPWANTSAGMLAGLGGSAGAIHITEGRTPLIPDEIFTKIFQLAWHKVVNANKLLDLRDGLAQIDIDLQHQNAKTISDAKRRYLVQNNWEGGLPTFKPALLDIRTACYIIVASLTGCRNHEIAFIQSGACHRTVDDEGEVYWWMKSRSTKTGEGKTEWMIPEFGVSALRIMERWAQPYQDTIKVEINRLRAINPSDPEIAECQKHQDALFLSGVIVNNANVRTLTGVTCGHALRAFTANNGIDWKLSTHQFRRKFANYAARSQFGDLRYLRDHFKHWSMDMSLGYALNGSQDLSLFLEIHDELDNIKNKVVGPWLEPSEPLAGGYGRSIISWRNGREVTIFKDRSSMIKAISDSTAIRANGHAWCTADDSYCVGNGGLETTRCVNCDNAVIGRAHANLYQGLYDQLKETLDCNDIGEAGMARVRRDIGRCRDVLTALGYRPLDQLS